LDLGNQLNKNMMNDKKAGLSAEEQLKNTQEVINGLIEIAKKDR
jgi:hypothetical protein